MERRGDRETDRGGEERGRGGEGELVTESLTEHISIFLIIPLDESWEREEAWGGGEGEEGGREKERERNQTPSDLTCPAVGMCVRTTCVWSVWICMCLACSRTGVQGVRGLPGTLKPHKLYVCVCDCMCKYVTARVSHPWEIVHWGASNMSARDTEPSLIPWPRLNTHTRTHTRTNTHVHAYKALSHKYTRKHSALNIHTAKAHSFSHILDLIRNRPNIFPLVSHTLLFLPLTHTRMLTHGLIHKDQHTHGPIHLLAPCLAPVRIQHISWAQRSASVSSHLNNWRRRRKERREYRCFVWSDFSKNSWHTPLTLLCQKY